MMMAVRKIRDLLMMLLIMRLSEKSFATPSTPSIDESGISHGFGTRFNASRGLTQKKSDENREQFSSLVKSWKKKHWYADSDCFRKTEKCSKIQEKFSCLGATLEYKEIIGSASPMAAQRYAHFSGLPKCWSVLRELLCAVNYPPCHDFRKRKGGETESRALLVSKHLCEKARRDCHFLVQHDLWPTELENCDNRQIYTRNCNAQELPQLHWNKTEKCMWPLVRSEFEPGLIIDQCALNCTSPWLADADHTSIQRWLPVVAWPMLIACLFSLVSTLVSWKKYNKSLDALFWCIMCFAIMCICWLLQLFGLRGKLTCLDDGSVRLQEPGNHAGISSCTMQFFFFYGSIFGCSGWLIVYCYCQFKCYSNSKGIENVKWSVFHLFTWAPSIIMNVFSLVLWKVESDGISGICFLGNTEPFFASGLLYAPLLLYLLVCWALIIVGVVIKSVKGRGKTAGCPAEARDVESEKKPRFEWMMFRFSLKKAQSESSSESLEQNRNETLEDTSKLVLVLALISACFAASLALHFAEMPSSRAKRDHLMRYLLCKLNQSSQESEELFYGELSEAGQCQLEGSADARLIHLHILLIQFLPGAALNLYFWTCNGVLTGYQEFWIWLKKMLRCAKLKGNTRVVRNQNGSVPRDDADQGLELTSLQSNVMSSSEEASGPEEGSHPRAEREKMSKRAALRQRLESSRKSRGGSRVSHHRSISGGSKTPSGNSLASTSLPAELYGSDSSLSFADLSKHPIISQHLYNKIYEKGFLQGLMQSSGGIWNPMAYSQPPLHPPLFSFTPATLVPPGGTSAVPSTSDGGKTQSSAAENSGQAGNVNFWNGSFDWMQYLSFLAAAGQQPPAPPVREQNTAEEEAKKTEEEEVQNSAKEAEEAEEIEKNERRSSGEIGEENAEEEEESEDLDFDDSMSDSDEEEEVKKLLEKYKYERMENGSVENGEREALLEECQE